MQKPNPFLGILPDRNGDYDLSRLDEDSAAVADLILVGKLTAYNPLPPKLSIRREAEHADGCYDDRYPDCEYFTVEHKKHGVLGIVGFERMAENAMAVTAAPKAAKRIAKALKAG